jgi:hypothetical protein
VAIKKKLCPESEQLKIAKSPVLGPKNYPFQLPTFRTQLFFNFHSCNGSKADRKNEKTGLSSTSHLYLKWKKCDLYADKVDCLGHIIDDEGIHPDTDKLGSIREWRTPRNYNDVQRFIGLVNYVSSFLPDIMAYTTPLQSMMQNGAPFFWRPLHQ